MRIELGALPPTAPISSSSIAPVAEITGRIALALAAAELAANAGQTSTSSAQGQNNGFVPLMSNLRAQPAFAGTTTNASESVTAMITSARQAALPDRVTLSSVVATAMASTALPQSDIPMTRPLSGALPMSAQAQAPAGNSMGGHSGNSTSSFADHVTLSPTATAVLTETPTLASKPSAQFLMHVLEAITGEPESQLQWLSLKAPPAPGVTTSYGPLQVSDKSVDMLSLFTQGTIRSLDQKMIPFGFSVTASRSNGVAETAMTNPQASQWLAQSKIVLDYPGPAADLAGHSLSFQTALDPRALWPMQSFMMSGALTMGRAREKNLEDELLDILADEEESAADQPPPRQRKKKAKPLVLDEPTPLAEDGGPPIITSRRWLELELRHLRLQMRNWMGLTG
jgi:hypothetical protein